MPHDANGNRGECYTLTYVAFQVTIIIITFDVVRFDKVGMLLSSSSHLRNSVIHFLALMLSPN